MDCRSSTGPQRLFETFTLRSREYLKTVYWEHISFPQKLVSLDNGALLWSKWSVRLFFFLLVLRSEISLQFDSFLAVSSWKTWRGNSGSDIISLQYISLFGVRFVRLYLSFAYERWLLHRLSKRQSLSTKTVLFRTMFTRTIILKLLVKWLLDVNLQH